MGPFDPFYRSINRFSFSVLDHHRPVRREALLLHCSDHRPVVMVRVHRCRGAALGTGEFRNWRWAAVRDEAEHVTGARKQCRQWCERGSKLLPVKLLLPLPQGYHHNHHHGNELGTWKQRDSCLRARRGKQTQRVDSSVDRCTHSNTPHTHVLWVRKHAFCWGKRIEREKKKTDTKKPCGFSWRADM